MPYLKLQHKGVAKKLLDEASSILMSPGMLNYLLTSVCLTYLQKKGEEKGSPSYSDFSEVIGALESAKLEFYRRAVVPYEDEKIKQNGDVY